MVLRRPLCLGLALRLPDLTTFEGRRKKEEISAAKGELVPGVVYIELGSGNVQPWESILDVGERSSQACIVDCEYL